MLECELQILLFKAKCRQQFLNKELESAERNLEKAETKYYDKSTAFCNQEKIVRSLASKLSHAKRKSIILDKVI